MPEEEQAKAEDGGDKVAAQGGEDANDRQNVGADESAGKDAKTNNGSGNDDGTGASSGNDAGKVGATDQINAGGSSGKEGDNADESETGADGKDNTTDPQSTQSPSTIPPPTSPPQPPATAEREEPSTSTSSPDSPQLGTNPDESDTLHSILFNQDGGCLSVGTGRGFRVCNVWPFGETFRREGLFGDAGIIGDQQSGGDGTAAPSIAGANNAPASTDGAGGDGGGGVGLVSMLYRTNLLALTSTTPPPINAHSRVTHSMHTAHTTKYDNASGHLAQVTSPSFPPNKVLIYDDALSRPIGELSFRHRVLCVKLRRDRIVVVLRDRIYVYRFSDLTLVDCVGTGRNEAGLVAISLEGATGTTGSGSGAGAGGGGMSGGGGARPSSNDDNAVMVLACPGVVTGQVRLELYGLRKTSLINAHESPLAALQVTNDGTLLVTASERGTVLRLFETGLVRRGHGTGSSRDATEATTGKPIREFRRGVERATVTCLSFSLDNTWMACGSDHGTVHVFKCWNNNDSAGNSSRNSESGPSALTKKKSKSPAKLLSKVLPTTKKYFMSEEASVAHVRGIPHPLACAFVPDRERTVAVAGTDELGNGCLLIAEFASEGGVGTEEMVRQEMLDGQNGKELSKSGKVRRLGYHRFFRKSSIAHHIPSSQRRHQSRQDRRDDAYYDELRISGARPEGESNINSVARRLDDVVFSEEGGGDDDGFDLVDVA